MSIQERLSKLAALVLSAWIVSACNTLEGVGEDVEAAGEEIQEAAE